MTGGYERRHLQSLRSVAGLLTLLAMVASTASPRFRGSDDCAPTAGQDKKGPLTIDLPSGWRREPTQKTWGAAPEMSEDFYLFSGEGQKIQITWVRESNDPKKLLKEALKYAVFGIRNARLEGDIVTKTVNGSPACWAAYKGTWIGTGGIPGWALCGGIADGEDGLFFLSFVSDDDIALWKDKIETIFDSIRGRNATATGGVRADAATEGTAADELRSSLDSGERAYGQQDFGNAIIFFSKAIELQPKAAHAYLRRAQSYVKSGKGDAYDKALADVDKVIALDPGNKDIPAVRTEAWNRKAELALGSGDHENAVFFYSKVIELDPNGAHAYLGRAQSYMKLGTRDGYDKALADAAKVAALDPGNKDISRVRAEAWSRKAEFALAERDRKRADEFLGKALTDYEMTLKEEPDSRTILLKIGEIRRYRGELDLALAAFSRVYEKDEYNYELGDLIKDLFKDFERQNRPIDCGNAPRMWELAAEFHYYGKRYDEALRCYDRALDLGLDPGKIWYTRSNVYAAKGDFDNALADADRLMKSGRPSMIDYKNRGEIYVKKGDLDKAINDFSTAIKLQLKDLKSDVVWEGKVGPLMDLYESRAKVYAAKKDWGQAIDDLKFVEKRLTDAAAKAVINLEIAKVYQEKGDAKNAAIYLEKARALDPNIKR